MLDLSLMMMIIMIMMMMMKISRQELKYTPGAGHVTAPSGARSQAWRVGRQLPSWKVRRFFLLMTTIIDVRLMIEELTIFKVVSR